MDRPFVPDGFEPPTGLRTERFVLEPLGPEHNERDHAAWSSSIDHILATPGFGEGEDPDDPDAEETWPRPLSAEQNLQDLEMHARHFRDREGFTYTVLDPGDGDVIGCVYLYPSRDREHDVRASSWVRASHADLDAPVWEAVRTWLAGDAWPFTRPDHAGRAGLANPATGGPDRP